jgi:hypothetical protein
LSTPPSQPPGQAKKSEAPAQAQVIQDHVGFSQHEVED